jgi:hypothetical protein
VAGARLGYRRLQASLTMNVPGTEEDIAKYGKSRYFDVQLGTTFRAADREWLLSGSFQVYRGFYLDNAGDVTPGTIPLYPDLSMVSMGAAITFFFNPAFSYDATFLDYRYRPRSSGSWALRGSIGLMGWTNDTTGPDKSIIPAGVRGAYGPLAGLNRSSSFYTGLSGGYAYDWVIRQHYFLSGALLVGGTRAQQTYEVDAVESSGSSISPAGVLTVASGYIGDTFHGGLYVNVDFDSTEIKDATATLIRAAVVFFAGARL